MRNRFAIYLIIFFITIPMFGCAGSPLMTGWEAKENRANMLKLKIGMNKEKVLSIMGTPYKTESYSIKDKYTEFWLYMTKGVDNENPTPQDSNFTPFAFENDVLSGWGRNYYDNALRIEQDIKIEIK